MNTTQPMSDAPIKIIVDGEVFEVAAGSNVAAMMLHLGKFRFRRSVTGQSRAPVCGMGICFECRVTIDGIAHQRSCTLLCRDGMTIMTDD